MSLPLHALRATLAAAALVSLGVAAPLAAQNAGPAATTRSAAQGVFSAENQQLQ